jgi:hypothetical protein
MESEICLVKAFFFCKFDYVVYERPHHVYRKKCKSAARVRIPELQTVRPLQSKQSFERGQKWNMRHSRQSNHLRRGRSADGGLGRKLVGR